jgi:hypothetical protein
MLEAMELAPSRRERQHRIEPIERLDRGLLIDAEHRRMRRGIEVIPSTSAALASKSGSSDAM